MKPTPTISELEQQIAAKVKALDIVYGDVTIDPDAAQNQSALEQRRSVLQDVLTALQAIEDDLVARGEIVKEKPDISPDPEMDALIARAKELGILQIVPIGGSLNKALLQDAIESTEKILNDPQLDAIAASLPPVTPPQKLTTCMVTPAPDKLKNPNRGLEQDQMTK